MEIKTGLWQRESKKGNKYYSGKFKLNGKEYYLSLFTNDKKGNEKAPEFQLVIRDKINNQDKTNEIPLKIEPTKRIDTNIYADFGEMTEDDFPEEPF